MLQSTAAFFGRFRELGWLHQMVREARTGRSHCLVVAGEAGIGKTALFDALAAELDVPLVRGIGTETGEAPAYSVLAQLLEPLRGHLDRIPGEQSRILAAASGWAPPIEAERFSVGAALVSLLGAAAGSVLVAIIDDAQFVDAASLEALTFAARRLDAVGVVLLFGVRTPGPLPAGLADLERMEMGGLDSDAARDLLAAHAGVPVSPGVAGQLAESTGGNPLVLLELARTLSADQLGGRQPLPRPLPIGEGLRETFEALVSALGPTVRHALLVVAASFGRIEVLTDALARLGLDTADLEEARRSELVYVRNGRIDFRHPMVRAVVYASATDEERRRAHQALADANAVAGDIERRAWHLVRCTIGPDDEAAAMIASAAAQVQERGGTAEAAAGYEAAARLTSDPELGVERLLRAGDLWYLAGRIDFARALAEEVLAHADPPAGRSGDAGRPAAWARAALLRGRALQVGSSEIEGRRYLWAAAQHAVSFDRSSAVLMAVAASGSALRAADVGEALDIAEAARDWAGEADEAARDLAELCWLAARVATGDLGSWRLLAQRAADAVTGRAPPELPLVTVNAAVALVWAGEHDGAHGVLEKLEHQARSATAPGVLAAVLTARAVLEHRNSRWRVAEGVATEALELAEQTGQRALAAYAAAVLATVEAILGRAEQCRARSLALLDSPARDVGIVRMGALSALGLLELGEGRPAEAVRWFEMLAGTWTSPARENPGIALWASDLAEAYIRSGQPDKARVVVEHLDQSTGAGVARGSSAARRTRAMLAEDDAEAEALFSEVVRNYGGPRWRFALGRTGLARGERLVRTGRVADGRERLERARALFAEIGARGWTARAEERLALLGPLPGPIGLPASELSPLELQIAGAAAFGARPAEIAAGLFQPEATVASHLRTAMAKLGVSSPDELKDISGLLVALGAPQTAAGPVLSSPTNSSSVTGTTARLRLLGTFEVVTTDGREEHLAGVVGQAVKHVALVGRLPIEELVEELWPEEPPGVARTRFRSLLNRLRRSVGPVLVRDGDWVTLGPGVEVDVHRFEDAVTSAQTAASSGDPRASELIRRSLDLYGGELLPTDRHLAFTAGPRERLRRRYLGMVGMAVEDAVRSDDVEAAVRLLEGAIAADPHDEALYLRAASILAGCGRRSEAASVLRRAKAMLSDLGLPLSPEGAELEKSLRALTD